MLFTLLTLLYDCIICSNVTSKGPHWQLHYHSLYSFLALVVFIAFDTTRHYIMGASQVALVVKNLPIRDTGSIPRLGRSLEEDMATHSSIPAWKIRMDREAWRATVHGVTKSWT